MFEGYKVYGPYGRDRKIMVFVSPEHRTTMSYAKYLMCLELGRVIGADGADEVVDHIDDDHTNDAIENLQILTAKENEEKESERRRRMVAYVALICPQCGKEFQRLRRAAHRASASKTPCCSRSCSVTFHQTGRKRKDHIEKS